MFQTASQCPQKNHPRFTNSRFVLQLSIRRRAFDTHCNSDVISTLRQQPVRRHA